MTEQWTWGAPVGPPSRPTHKPEDIQIPAWVQGIADREGVKIYARRVTDEDGGHSWTYQVHSPEEFWLRWVVVRPNRGT